MDWNALVTSMEEKYLGLFSTSFILIFTTGLILNAYILNSIDAYFSLEDPVHKTSNDFYFLKTLTNNSFRGDNFTIDQGLYFNLVPSLNVCQGSFPVVRIILTGGEAGGAGIV